MEIADSERLVLSCMNERIETQNYFLRYIRDIMFAFLAIWLINPQSSFSQVYNWNFYGLALLVWVGTAFVSDTMAFLSTIRKTALIWLWPCYLLLASLFGHAEFSIKQFTTPFILIFFLYYLWARRSKFFKVAISLMVIYTIVIITNTIAQNIINPQVSRYLAHGDVNETYSLSSPFLANFFFVYAMTGAAVALAALFKKRYTRRITNIILIALWVIVTSLFIRTEYMIATISVVIVSAWIFIMYTHEEAYSKLTIRKAVLFMAMLFVVMMVYLNIGDILQLLYNTVTGDNIRLRLSNIISITNSTASVSSLTRTQLYMRSISTFFSSLEHFLFGVGYGAGIGLIGQHSQIFDTFGRYGIIGGLCWILGVLKVVGVILSSVDYRVRRIITFVLIDLLIISFLNPTYNDLLLMFFFFIIPEMVRYLCSRPSSRTEMMESNID